MRPPGSASRRNSANDAGAMASANTAPSVGATYGISCDGALAAPPAQGSQIEVGQAKQSRTQCRNVTVGADPCGNSSLRTGSIKAAQRHFLSTV